MTDRDDDLEQRLRRHFAALPGSSPPAVVDAARNRIVANGRRGSSWPVRLAAAATIVSVIVGAVVITGSSPDPSPRPSSATPSASSTTEPPAALAKGVVAEVVRPFSLVTDRGVLVGQRVYVVDGPTPHEGKPSYLVQHWGDLDHGLRPNSDFGWMGSTTRWYRLDRSRSCVRADRRPSPPSPPSSRSSVSSVRVVGRSSLGRSRPASIKSARRRRRG